LRKDPKNIAVNLLEASFYNDGENSGILAILSYLIGGIKKLKMFSPASHRPGHPTC